MLRCSRIGLALIALAAVTGVAFVQQASEPAGVRMADAAGRWLDSLTAEQRARAIYDFDAPERTNWHFVPQQDASRHYTRKGLPLEEMTEVQQKAARELLRAGTGTDGYAAATTIMSLESILRELEKGGNIVRNPGWYFFTIFGTPSKTGKWGWRVEGHHLCLNFVMDQGKVVSASPAIFGANPAVIQQGPQKGKQALPDVDNLARQLYLSLDEEQKKLALHKGQFPEIKEATTRPDVGEPQGLPAAKMDAKQKELLQKLLRTYTSRMPVDVAESELAAIREAGLDQVHFAYAGGVEPGQPHTYRVQGPTFVVEFLNVQADSARNPANHIHSGWRNPHGDLGLTKQ